jgi:hypothetical protein
MKLNSSARKTKPTAGEGGAAKCRTLKFETVKFRREEWKNQKKHPKYQKDQKHQDHEGLKP